MNIANLNKNNTMMSYKQLSLILTIFILLSLSSACSPAINPTDNTVFTPGEHISISDSSSSLLVPELSIEVDENDSTKIIISGLVNSIGADKTYTLTINPVTGVFSTPEDSPVTITITEPDGFSPGDVVLSLSSFIITNDNDSENPISYTVVVPFSGAPVEDWLTSDSLSKYIKSTFATQAASLTLSENILSVNGLTNVSDGTGAISFTLPLGFVANPESITLPVPDGAATIIPSSATFTISETGNTKNSQTYTIDTITLAAVTAFTPSVHISIADSSSVPRLSIGVDENDSTKIIISGLVNSIGAGQTYTFTINPVMDLFSTPDDSPITITITEPDGFSPVDVVPSPSSFTITNDNDPSIPIDYTVEVQFSGAPVQDWLTSDSLSTYITAKFARQTASLILNGYTLSVNGLINVDTGTGTISFSLPEGFEANPNPFTFTDPDDAGTGQTTFTPSPATFTISETDNSARSQEYTVSPIDLKNLIDFTPDEHIVITDDTSSDRVPGLTIRVDENDTTKIIIVSGLVNSIGADKTYTLTIAPEEDGFSTPENSPITITITEPDGFSPGDGGLSLSNSFTITNVSDPSMPITYTVVVPFSGAPVEDWFNTDYISATFASQAASLILNGYTLSVNDLTNVSNGTNGSIVFNLPSGFVADPESITLTDPDGPLTDTATITLDPNTFTISETGNTDNNLQQYTVNNPINLSSLTVFTPGEHISISESSSSPSLTGLSIGVDENDSTKIVISGLVNTIGADKTYTLTIAPKPGVFNTQGNITITITEPQDFSPGPGVLTPDDSFTITNNNDPSMPITYTVEVPFSGAPVEDWLTETTFSTYITATFASQAASLELIGNALSVNDLTNAIDGTTGSIEFTLPTGFVANPESITLPDPDGAAIGAATIIPNPANFTISETDNNANSQPYTVNPIILNRLIVFTADEHIKVSDGSTDITDSLSIELDENDSTKIIISGLVNSIGADKTYTLTIAPVADGFSTLGNSPITITITEPTGFSPGDGVLLPSDSFTITNNNDPSNPIIYTVEVPFSGAKVNEWLTADTFPNYFTGATYAGQTALLSFDGSTIAIGGDINNVLDGEILLTRTLPLGYSVTGLDTLSDPDGDGIADLTDGRAGTITIAEEDTANTNNYDVTISLAAYRSPVEASQISVTGIDGFILDSNIDIQIEQNIITISGLSNGTSGSGSVSITQPTTGEFTVDPNPFSLSFDDSDGIFATEGTQIGTVDIVSAAGFTVSHTVILSLTAYTSPVEVSHVTAMFNGNTAGPSEIEISGTDIIISGFPNIAGSTGSGSVSITPTTAYTIDPLSLSFTDPDGTDSQDIEAGTVSVTSAGVSVFHTIIIRFSTLIELKIASLNVVNSPLIISSGATVNITGLGACELLPPPTFEIIGNTSATVRGFPSYFDRRKDSSNGLAPYTVNRDLILEDARGILDDTFTVSITGFPACDDATIFTNTGNTGADADPYFIDSAQKLELLSHLVHTDNDNSASKSYKLTADIDLGLAGLPWSEDASGETGEGFPPIGFGLSSTHFNGTFDCANNSISGLYINQKRGLYKGLFGSISGASIQNCSLINVNVTGLNSVGGLVGYLSSSSITNSYVTGSVEGVGGSGSSEYVGGLAGRLYDSSITNSYATGSVSGEKNVGGLVGYLSSSSITNSYATGSVSGTVYSVGGLVGRLYETSSIENSYATGSVSGTASNAGGLAGSQSSNSTITNSYWDIVTSRQDTSAGDAVGKTTSDLQSGSAGVDIFTGWSSSIWKFDPTTQYPRLKTVVCANRQYADPNNVPTACTDL